MKYEDGIVDRQVGRNGDLFAASIGQMETREERYPYLRILVSIVEQAHPEWNQAPTKDSQISLLIFRMSKATLDRDEVAEIVQLRDAERGFNFIERKPEKSPSDKDERSPSDKDERSPSDKDERSPSDKDERSLSDKDERSPSDKDERSPSDKEKSDPDF